MKDSVASRLPARGHGEGVEASGASGCAALPEFKFGFGGSFMVGAGGVEEGKKMAFMLPKEEQKGKLSMDPMVETSLKSTDFLAAIEESISLVEKATGMPSATSGGLVP